MVYYLDWQVLLVIVEKESGQQKNKTEILLARFVLDSVLDYL